MRQANNPLRQMHNHLTRVTLAKLDYHRISADAGFNKRLELIAKCGSLELPPTTVHEVKCTSYSKTLVCEGFRLTTKFPNNFAYIGVGEDLRRRTKVLVVEDITFDNHNEIWLEGFLFENQRSIWTIPGVVDFSNLQCHKVSSLSRHVSKWKVADTLVGKGFAVDLGLNVLRGMKRSVKRSIPDFHDQEWIVQPLMHSLK